MLTRVLLEVDIPDASCGSSVWTPCLLEHTGLGSSSRSRRRWLLCWDTTCQNKPNAGGNRCLLANVKQCEPASSNVDRAWYTQQSSHLLCLHKRPRLGKPLSGPEGPSQTHTVTLCAWTSVGISDHPPCTPPPPGALPLLAAAAVPKGDGDATPLPHSASERGTAGQGWVGSSGPSVCAQRSIGVRKAYSSTL